MKKRLMASLFVCMFSLTLIPTASAAGYAPPTLPDVFQGDGLYITATPLEPKLAGSFVPDSDSSAPPAERVRRSRRTRLNFMAKL